MLIRKALNKIWIVTLIVFIVFAIYIIPTKIKQNKVINTDIAVKYVDSNYRSVYLVNEYDQLVIAKVLMEKSDDIILNIKSVLNSLIISKNTLIPDGLNPLIPKKTKVINVTMENGIVSIYFSSNILGVDSKYQELLIESISYSLFQFSSISGVSIYVDDKNINQIFKIGIPDVITREYGINKRYEVNRLSDIERVVIYYVNRINDKSYYVPITKYVNNDAEKIKIIIDELSGSYIYEPNLISYLNKETILTEYEILNDKIILNFNNSIFMSDGTILEEVLYTLSYSLFDTYGVNEVIFQVNGNNFVKKVIKEVE